MIKTNIRINNTKEKFIDTKGYLSKAIQIKRLAKYANEIDMVLTKYSKKSCDETMMVKGPRKSNAQTTNRKIHTEDLEKTVAQIAKGLGLNVEIIKIMGKHHDTGHTFLGHSGEWWISNVLEDYGLGCFCHNTLGASELIYTHQIYDEIIKKVKVHNPQIKSKELARIRRSLWLIMDAINGHNGEMPDKIFIPEFTKTEQDFETEMLKCYTTPKYDRKIKPATSEGNLMRLGDKISYAPLDMIDGLQEGMIRDENGQIIDYLDEDYRTILTKIGITKEEFDMANSKKDYIHIVERIREIFINDVIKNSTKRKIKMSDEMMILMGELIDCNNIKAVRKVVLTEDKQTYPPAIRQLINGYKEILLENQILSRLPNANTDIKINQELERYKNTPYEGFINYICKTNPEDYAFYDKIVEEATKQSIQDELTLARTYVEKRELYQDKKELGLDYTAKNSRIKQYIQYYESQIQKGNLVGYGEQDLQEDTQAILTSIKSGKHNPNYLSKEERMAIMIGAKYLSTLNDTEFMQLLQDTNIISKEQYNSLTRKYKDIPNLDDEVSEHENFKEISTMQKKATKRYKEEAQI